MTAASGVTTLGTDGGLFEALFRVRPPDGLLRAQLLALGVDPADLQPRYRSTQWLQALSLYRAALFPELPATDGNRRLGVALAEGYGHTVSGRILLATLPLMAPEQLLRRWPRFVRMGRTDVTITVTETDARSMSIHSIDPVCVPFEINQGLLDVAFEKMGETPRYGLELRSPEEVVMQVSW